MQEQERAITSNTVKRPEFLRPNKLAISHRHQLSCQQEAQELSEMHPHLPTEIDQIGGFRCSTSKNTPAIAAARSLHFCPYLDSMLYRGSSAATLQHSSIFWSFPKQKRNENQQNSNQNLWKDWITLKSELKNREIGMGFGEKARVWSREQESRAKANPDPGRYNLLTDIEEGIQKKKGIVFGESHSKYKKNYYPEFKHENIPELASKLGPGQYFTSREEIPFGINAKKYSFGGKHSHNYELRVAAEMPSCMHYSPQNSLVKSARFSDIGFGIGVYSFVLYHFVLEKIIVLKKMFLSSRAWIL